MKKRKDKNTAPAKGLFDDPNASFTAGSGDDDTRPAKRKSKPTKSTRNNRKAARKEFEAEGPGAKPVVTEPAKPPVVIVEDSPAVPLVPPELVKASFVTKSNDGMNREAWLTRGVELMTPLFEQNGYKVPPVRVTCGWPSTKGLAAKSRAVGECWSTESAKDGVNQIFISPFLDQSTPDGAVLATLVHEVVHAVVGLKAKHGKLFKKCALAVGLEGKMTATFAGEALKATFAQWEAQLGKYSHAQLDALKRPTKKQSTRMIKCECGTCGFTVRTTRKWLEEVGAPHCPKHGAMEFEIPADLDTNDDDGGENEGE